MHAYVSLRGNRLTFKRGAYSRQGCRLHPPSNVRAGYSSHPACLR
jgi:hypothetical protein